jgi:hypothetical protein
MEEPTIPSVAVFRARAIVEEVLDMLARDVFTDDVELNLIARHKKLPDGHLMISASKLEDLRSVLDFFASRSTS